MKKRKLLSLVLSFILVFGVTGTLGGAGIASASVRDIPVAGNILTETGLLNEVDWGFRGDTASASFVKNVKGDLFVADNIPWGSGFLAPWDSFKFSDGPVKVSFDIMKNAGTGICPYIAPGIDNRLNTLWFSDNGWLDPGASNNKDSLDYFKDEEMTQNYCEGKPNVVTYGIYPTAETPNGTHVEFTFKPDGSLGASCAAINDDGTVAADSRMLWIKNAFPVNDTDDFHTGMCYFGTLWIDNYMVAQGERVIIQTDFSNSAWSENQGIPTPGKVLNNKGTCKSVAEVVLKPANGDRIVTEEKIVLNEDVNKAAAISGSVDFRKLSKKFGFLFGLQDQMTAVNADGLSYLYFIQKENTTYINVINNGQDGTEVSLEADFVAGDFYDFSVEVEKDGKATVKIGDKTAEVILSNIEGYVAIVTDGEGEVEAAVTDKLHVLRYQYRGSKGAQAGNNFNTGYINPENWEMHSNGAVMYEDASMAKGLVFEDGKLKFSGTADGTYFGTAEAYSDFIMEFKIEEFNIADKPAFKETWIYGAAPCEIILAVSGPGSGWINGLMFRLGEDNMLLEDFTGTNGGKVTAGSYPDGFRTKPAEAGKSIISAIKVVAANGNVKIYAQDITTEAFAPERYVKGIDVDVDDTYGRITLATTEGGYFNIDDLKVTPVDDPDPEAVNRNIAAYKDFEAIPDESAPVVLDAPVLSIEGYNVKWNAVENAAGYIISINGEERELAADVLSYEFAEEGSYSVFVIAKGNGETVLDSEESDPLEFEIEAREPDNSGESGEPGTSEISETSEEEEKGGCGGTAGGAGIGLALAALAGISVIFKKRKNQ